MEEQGNTFDNNNEEPNTATAHKPSERETTKKVDVVSSCETYPELPETTDESSRELLVVKKKVDVVNKLEYYPTIDSEMYPELPNTFGESAATYKTSKVLPKAPFPKIEVVSQRLNVALHSVRYVDEVTEKPAKEENDKESSKLAEKKAQEGASFADKPTSPKKVESTCEKAINAGDTSELKSPEEKVAESSNSVSKESAAAGKTVGAFPKIPSPKIDQVLDVALFHSEHSDQDVDEVTKKPAKKENDKENSSSADKPSSPEKVESTCEKVINAGDTSGLKSPEDKVVESPKSVSEESAAGGKTLAVLPKTQSPKIELVSQVFDVVILHSELSDRDVDEVGEKSAKEEDKKSEPAEKKEHEGASSADEPSCLDKFESSGAEVRRAGDTSPLKAPEVSFSITSEKLMEKESSDEKVPITPTQLEIIVSEDPAKKEDRIGDTQDLEGKTDEEETTDGDSDFSVVSEITNDVSLNTKTCGLIEKLSEQQKENSDLKLQLNASQETRASLELAIRQREEFIIKIQTEALKKEEVTKYEIEQLREKLKENMKQIEKRRESQEQLKEAQAGETKAVTEKTMEDYENIIATLLANYQKLKEEHETATRHLANTELAFSDVQQKYERSKTTLKEYEANQETVVASLQALDKICKADEEKYESLKARALAHIEMSNKEILKMKENYDTDLNNLKAIKKRLEIKCGSLEVFLRQKTEECAALSALCDEFIGEEM